jgi:hypothetical protein
MLCLKAENPKEEIKNKKNIINATNLKSFPSKYKIS